MCDLAHLDDLGPQIERLCAHHDALRAGFGEPPIDRDRLLGDLRAIAAVVLPYAKPVWVALNEAKQAGKRILFEGAQGILLDVDHGTYPFVTSSNTIAGTAAGGSGIGPAASASCWASSRPIRRGSARGRSRPSWTTRSASGSATRGHEFGTVTGRKRRCGWFDAVLVRQAAAVSGISGIALTKLDVLDGFDELKICAGYRIGDTLLRLSAAACRRPGRGRADLRDDRGLERDHRRRAQLGRSARGGDQIHPPRARN